MPPILSTHSPLLEDSDFPIRLLETHDYALIDRYMLGDALGDVTTIAPDLLPVVPSDMESDQGKFPALLSLKALAENARQALFTLLEDAHRKHISLPIVCLFQSSASLKQLRGHWIQQMIVQTAQGQKFQLRSYVPNVVVQLQRIYTPAQIKALFGGIEVWSIYLDQHWHALRPPEASPTHNHLINETQLGQLVRVQAINRTLAELDAPQEDNLINSFPRPPYRSADPTNYFELSNKIDELILRAQAHGLAREDDQVQFALHGLTLHPQFDAHPRIKKMLAQLDGEEQTYLDAIALLQPDDWQRIQADLLSTASHKA